MEMTDKLIIALFGWGMLAVLANPWMDNKRLTLIALALFAAGTALWVTQ